MKIALLLLVLCPPILATASETAAITDTRLQEVRVVFDRPLRQAMISMSHALQHASPLESTIPEEAFRLFLCAERFQRHYDPQAWQSVRARVDSLFMEASGRYAQGSRTNQQILHYRAVLAKAQ